MNNQIYKFLIFPSGRRWVWEVYAPNGVVMCRSCNSFKYAGEAKKSALSLITTIRDKTVHIIEESSPTTRLKTP